MLETLKTIVQVFTADTFPFCLQFCFRERGDWFLPERVFSLHLVHDVGVGVVSQAVGLWVLPDFAALDEQ